MWLHFNFEVVNVRNFVCITHMNYFVIAKCVCTDPSQSLQHMISLSIYLSMRVEWVMLHDSFMMHRTRKEPMSNFEVRRWKERR